MKLLEYKPHDIWFIWIHPCYLVQTTNGEHWIDKPFRYYYGRTHLSEQYRKQSIADSISNIRRNGNFASMRGHKGFDMITGIDPFKPSIEDEISLITILNKNKQGGSLVAEYLSRGALTPIYPTDKDVVDFKEYFNEHWMKEEKNNKSLIIDFDYKPRMFYPYSIPTDLIRDIKALLTKYDIFLSANKGDNILEEREKLTNVLKQLNELK